MRVVKKGGVAHERVVRKNKEEYSVLAAQVSSSLLLSSLELSDTKVYEP